MSGAKRSTATIEDASGHFAIWSFLGKLSNVFVMKSVQICLCPNAAIRLESEYNWLGAKLFDYW